MAASLLAVLVVSVLVAALARRFDLSAPLALVVAGLAAGLIPGLGDIELDPDLVLFVILPPLLWSAGIESSYLALRRNVRPIALLAVGLPLATTVAVGVVAFHTVPELTIPAALTLGAIVAPPDAVSATAIGRRVGLPRRTMTLLGGESLLNDATALTAYKVALAAAVGAATSWGDGLATFALAAAGGVVVGAVLGALLSWIRWRLDDPLAESALGLVAPFLIYLAAEEIRGSGVLAVVVAALIAGQRSTRAGYATRLQDFAVWKAVQLVLESFAFLMIGLQLPKVVSELAGISAATIAVASAAVVATVIVVRIVWMYLFAYLEAAADARAEAAAQDKASRAAAERLEELLTDSQAGEVPAKAGDVLRAWNAQRRKSAFERLSRGATGTEAHTDENPSAAFRRLRLEMLAAERAAFIAERDGGRIDDEVLRSVLRNLDLEEATLNSR